jgi:protein-disulfide isomerase
MAKARAQSRSSKSRAQSERGMLVSVTAVVGLVFLIAIVLIVLQIRNSTTTAVTSGGYAQIPQSTTPDGAPVLGSPTAKVTIMEFADFSCPHCMEYHPTVQKLIDNYVRPGKARLIFRPETFVGDRMGDYSQIASQAAFCAAKQGKFWDMHDALFKIHETRSPTGFTLPNIQAAATELSLNSNDLMSCITSRETVPAIQSGIQLGQNLGLTGTPYVVFSVDGTNFTPVPGPDGLPYTSVPPYELIASAIDKAYQTAQ